MGIVSRYPPWGIQPQAPAPLNTGLIGNDALVWTGAFPDRIFGSGGSVAGSSVNTLRNVGYPGQAAYWTDGANSQTGITFAPLLAGVTGGFSILALAAPIAEAVTRVVASHKAGGYFVQQWNLAFNSGDNISNESGSLRFYMRDNSAFTFNTRATGQVDGGLHCWVATNSTSGGSIHRDGVDQTLSTNNATFGNPVGDPSHALCIGNLYNTDFTTRNSNPTFLVAMWPRQIPLKLRQFLSLNPWQLFAPMPRRYSLAAATGIPTLSAATVTAITATTVRPRVTVTF